MINVSSIKLYMYCPMKLYIKTHMDREENEDYQIAIEIKKLKIDIQDLIQKNMRKVKRDMPIAEIEGILSQNIDPHIESSAASIKAMDLYVDSSKINEIIDDAYFSIKITAIKIKQAMTILKKDGFAITDLFFPNCMYSYLVKNKDLDIIGICDKIEIVDGTYYPVSIKSSNPPLKGVWDGDAIELVANAILIEEDFKTEVFVGFVYYEKIDDRRPVVMDVTLRKELFDIIRDVKEIIENKRLPEAKMNPKKCDSCEYRNICVNE